MVMMILHLQDPKIRGYVASATPIALGFPGHTTRIIFRRTSWLTLEVFTVIVVVIGSFEAWLSGKAVSGVLFFVAAKNQDTVGNGGWCWCLGHGWVNEASIKTESVDSIRR